MKTTAVGRSAETAAALHLVKDGYKILARNWKTKLCEIDIVACKDDITYFVEVKYRLGEEQGSGLEHITPKKLNQIKFAVRVWCHNNNWQGDCRIFGAEVSGLKHEEINFVEILD